MIRSATASMAASPVLTRDRIETTPVNDGTINVHSNNRWAIRRRDLYNATENLPEDHKGTLRWLDAHARQKNYSVRELAALIKDEKGRPYSENTVYKIMTGRHEAKLDNFIRAVLNYQLPFHQRRAEEKIPFVRTLLASSIMDYCEAAKKYGRMGLVYGRNQSGKTEAFRQLAVTKPYGQVRIYRMPTKGYLSTFLEMACRQDKIATRAGIARVKDNFLASFDSSMIVIIDEAHQCFLNEERKAPRIDTIEFAREIYDRSGATVILCGTPLMQDQLEKGVHEELFGQLRHRGLPPYVINPIVPEEDLNSFAEVLGLEPADGPALTLQTAIIAREGLGYWLMYLQCARGIAAKAEKPLHWDHVLAADQVFRSMSKPERKEKKS